MGLKTTNYEVRAYGVILPEAYALIDQVNVSGDGHATAGMRVQQSREFCKACYPFEMYQVECNIDKSLPLYEQLYNKAKADHFIGWEDDIVPVEVIVPEEPVIAETPIEELVVEI